MLWKVQALEREGVEGVMNEILEYETRFKNGLVFSYTYEIDSLLFYTFFYVYFVHTLSPGTLPSYSCLP